MSPPSGVLSLERASTMKRRDGSEAAPHVSYRVTFLLRQIEVQNCIGVARVEGRPRLTMNETALQPPALDRGSNCWCSLPSVRPDIPLEGAGHPLWCEPLQGVGFRVAEGLKRVAGHTEIDPTLSQAHGERIDLGEGDMLAEMFMIGLETLRRPESPPRRAGARRRFQSRKI